MTLHVKISYRSHINIKILYHLLLGDFKNFLIPPRTSIKTVVVKVNHNDRSICFTLFQDGSLQLIPLCVDTELKEVPANFGKVQMTKATSDVLESVISVVCKAVVSWLSGKEVDPRVECIFKPDEVSS